LSDLVRIVSDPKCMIGVEAVSVGGVEAARRRGGEASGEAVWGRRG
jgi:hypothetical protein